MTDRNAWNNEIIAEFRANKGHVSGRFDDATVILLHTIGAKTGIERVNPLVCQDLGGSLAVFASHGGAPTNPDWFHNVRANPRVRIEIGTAEQTMQARVAEGEERDRIWERQKELSPGFAEYERKTDRTIPVVVLEPVEV